MDKLYIRVKISELSSTDLENITHDYNLFLNSFTNSTHDSHDIDFLNTIQVFQSKSYKEENLDVDSIVKIQLKNFFKYKNISNIEYSLENDFIQFSYNDNDNDNTIYEKRFQDILDYYRTLDYGNVTNDDDKMIINIELLIHLFSYLVYIFNLNNLYISPSSPELLFYFDDLFAYKHVYDNVNKSF